MRHLMGEQNARLALLIGDLAYANGVQASAVAAHLSSGEASTSYMYFAHALQWHRCTQLLLRGLAY
jgi:hypothetical protein